MPIFDVTTSRQCFFPGMDLLLVPGLRAKPPRTSEKQPTERYETASESESGQCGSIPRAILYPQGSSRPYLVLLTTFSDIPYFGGVTMVVC